MIQVSGYLYQILYGNGVFFSFQKEKGLRIRKVQLLKKYNSLTSSYSYVRLRTLIN